MTGRRSHRHRRHHHHRHRQNDHHQHHHRQHRRGPLHHHQSLESSTSVITSIIATIIPHNIKHVDVTITDAPNSLKQPATSRDNGGPLPATAVPATAVMSTHCDSTQWGAFDPWPWLSRLLFVSGGVGSVERSRSTRSSGSNALAFYSRRGRSF